MRTALLALVLVVAAAVSVRANEQLSIEAIAAIAKIRAKAPRPVPPPATKPEDKPKASIGKVQWQTYANAHKAYLANKQPLFVMIGAEWCGPCKSLKAAVEKANVPGVNYAYID